MTHMASHVALLRAVNVGATGRLAMAELRAAVGSLGHRDVQTYAQSGNVIFTACAPETANAELETALSAAIERSAGFAPSTLVLTVKELSVIAGANPYFEQAASAPKDVHALVLPSSPGSVGEEQLAEALRRAAAKGGRATLVDRTI